MKNHLITGVKNVISAIKSAIQTIVESVYQKKNNMLTREVDYQNMKKKKGARREVTQTTHLGTDVLNEKFVWPVGVKTHRCITQTTTDHSMCSGFVENVIGTNTN